MPFLKEDLQLTHYSWGEGIKTPLSGGVASRRTFNRFSGEQVLLMINLCVEAGGPTTLADGRKLEERILHELPLEPRSELSVFNWLMSGNGNG